jgi:hypothetical protein
MMMLKRFLICALACPLLAHCADTAGDSPSTTPEQSADDGVDPGKADEAGCGEVAQMSWASTWDRWTTEALDACGFNDSSRVGTYDVAGFDATAALAEIRLADGACEGGRTYSNSRENGIELFLEHIESDPMTSVCLSEDVSQYSTDRALDIIHDADNLGVFASLFPEGAGDAEMCAFYHFYIFRADGTLLRWTFSYVD